MRDLGGTSRRKRRHPTFTLFRRRPADISPPRLADPLSGSPSTVRCRPLSPRAASTRRLELDSTHERSPTWTRGTCRAVQGGERVGLGGLSQPFPTVVPAGSACGRSGSAGRAAVVSTIHRASGASCPIQSGTPRAGTGRLSHAAIATKSGRIVLIAAARIDSGGPLDQLGGWGLPSSLARPRGRHGGLPRRAESEASSAPTSTARGGLRVVCAPSTARSRVGEPSVHEIVGGHQAPPGPVICDDVAAVSSTRPARAPARRRSRTRTSMSCARTATGCGSSSSPRTCVRHSRPRSRRTARSARRRHGQDDGTRRCVEGGRP